ncbi:LPXTG cell wall anchor domain-containing protein [Enterococcus crotali]|uniref:LPXTG cell wall anchor domain-containing protein n=1 Tax=Enterococcus crotali TaxID=1453587 RepID=UPI0006865F5B|nr:LPXTG cell wall anchor domain-containing protein [Enterococcus crotali]
MKKLALIISCFGCIVLLNMPYVSAEEPVPESTSTSLVNDSSTTDSSVAEMTSSDLGVSSINSTETTSDDIELTLRQNLLLTVPYYGLTEELINRLSDEQLGNAKNMAFHFINQDISGSAKMVVKIYGDNPIPKESYSINYTTLSTDELKNFLPQIRLSLIYVYDLDKNLINSLSNQELIDIIDNIKLSYDNSDDPTLNAHGEYALAAMADQIESGNYISGSSNSSADTDSTSGTSSTDTTKTTESKKNTSKKESFPNTGEKRNKALVILGVSIIILLIATVFIRNRKKHF